MTDAAILQQYEDFIDGQSTLSQALEIQLANNAKNAIETELKLEITKKLDTSKTATVGGTYLTPFTQPTDYFSGTGYIYVGRDKFRQVPLEFREFYRDQYGFFYIDQRSKLFYLCGTQNSAQPIIIPYFIATTDITTASVAIPDTTVTWPDRFHTLIAMEMAKMYYTIDAGDKNRAWDDRWTTIYQAKKNELITWDADLKLNATSNETPYGAERVQYRENTINDMP